MKKINVYLVVKKFTKIKPSIKQRKDIYVRNVIRKMLELNKKYKTILIDPPWQMDKRGGIPLNGGKWKSPLYEKYKSMSKEEITNLPINQLSDKECDLFLWTTHTFLVDALEIMEIWGFKYHCLITWDKMAGFTMYGFHRRTELCLYGYKGRLGIRQKGISFPLLITEKSKKHSQKPNCLYVHIERKTNPPRLELFARNRRQGWDVWGLEAPTETQNILPSLKEKQKGEGGVFTQSHTNSQQKDSHSEILTVKGDVTN